MYVQLIFDKAGKNNQRKKDSLFSKWCFTPYTKINSKWTKDLNLRQETIKILEEKTGNNLFDVGHSNFLLNMSLEARETKAKTN